MAPRFGIFLSAQHPPAMTASQIARDCCEQVRLARELGLEDVSAGQHFLTQPYQMLQLVPLLARIAAEAGEMRVGAGILLLTLLNPVEVAENAATLDAITDGRFVLGLGLGYRQEENDAFGLPEKRLAVFEQKLDVVRRLLEGEAVTAEGHGFRLQRPAARAAADADAAAADLARREQRQRRAARRTARRRMAAQPAHEARRARAPARALPRRARALRPAAGEPRSRSSRSSTSAATTSPRCARSGRILEDKYKAYVQWGQSEVLPEGDTLRQAFEQLAEGGRFIVGGPESCARQVREHVERLGATSFLFRFQWPGMPQELVLSSMRRAAEEVFPLVLASASSRALDARGGRDARPGGPLAAGLGPRREARDRGQRNARAAQPVEHRRRRDVRDREAAAAGPRRGVVEQALEALELRQRRGERGGPPSGAGASAPSPPPARRPYAASSIGSSAGRRYVAIASSSQLTVARSGRSDG